MKINIHVTIIMLTLCSISFLWTGCSNDDGLDNSSSQMVSDYSGKPIPVKAVVAGLSDFSSGSVITRSGASVQKETFVQPLNEREDTGFDIETIVEPVTKVATRAGEPPLLNSFFRVLAYRNNKVSAENFAGQGDFIADANGVVTPVTGRSLALPEGPYLFVCYSYGTSEVVDILSPTATTVPVSQSQDFMICSLSKTVVADENGEYPLSDIVFNRLCCLLQLEVTVDGFPENNIQACAATVSNINDNIVNWTVGANELPLTGTSGSLDFDFTLNTAVATTTQKIALSTSPRDLIITFSALTIGEVSYPNTVVTVPRQLVAAGNYKIKMNINQNYILVNGYKWAKGNLYKDGDKYLFEATQEAYHVGADGGGYFGYNTDSSTTGDFSEEEYSYATDPCSKAKPVNTWQTPTKIITESLRVNPTYDEVKKGMWFGTGNSKVFLPYAGIRTGDGSVIGVDEGAYYGLQNTYSDTFYFTFMLYKDSAPDWMDRSYRNWGSLIRCVKIR